MTQMYNVVSELMIKLTERKSKCLESIQRSLKIKNKDIHISSSELAEHKAFIVLRY